MRAPRGDKAAKGCVPSVETTRRLRPRPWAEGQAWRAGRAGRSEPRRRRANNCRESSRGIRSGPIFECVCETLDQRRQIALIQPKASAQTHGALFCHIRGRACAVACRWIWIRPVLAHEVGHIEQNVDGRGVTVRTLSTLDRKVRQVAGKRAQLDNVGTVAPLENDGTPGICERRFVQRSPRRRDEPVQFPGRPRQVSLESKKPMDTIEVSEGDAVDALDVELNALRRFLLGDDGKLAGRRRRTWFQAARRGLFEGAVSRSTAPSSARRHRRAA